MLLVLIPQRVNIANDANNHARRRGKINHMRRAQYIKTPGVLVRFGNWFSRKRKPILYAVYSVVLFIMLIQIFYPGGRAAPFAHAAGKSVGFYSRNDLNKKLQALSQSATIESTIDGKTITATVVAIGGTYDEQATLNKALSYPLWARLVPLSIFFIHSKDMVLQYSYDDDKVAAYVQKTADTVYLAPVNATLAVKDNKVVINKEMQGAKLDTDAFKKRLKQASIPAKGHVAFGFKRTAVQPARNTAAIDKVRSSAEKALKKQLVIKALNKDYTVQTAELGKWLQFNEGEKNAYSVTINDETLTAYLTSIASTVYIAPGVTKVTVVDGEETSRIKGSDGRGLDTTAVKQAVQAALFENKTATIEAKVSAIAPKEDVTSTYSATQKGLQAYLTSLASKNSMNISVRQLDGAGWSASARAGDTVVSASTYKLFVAYALFERIKQGAFKWDDTMLDTTISGCFDRMIVRSDNACAEKFIDMMSRATIDSILSAHGFSSATRFNVAHAAQTTSASDLVRLLMGLNDGSLIGGDDRTKLLADMSRQIYRQGIPSGSRGSVADKVGFLDEVLNDAAIVSTPRGTYVVSIMTRNSSWAEIAAITKKIESLMYP
jgi:beta-lactamase class A